MVQSAAATVDEYLAELPAERAAVVSRVRDLVVANLPEGYTEGMNWGMISYEIPLERYPNTYNGQPLVYVALAAQKNHYALYLMGSYSDSTERWLREEFAKAGKKLDMGKSCVRFKKIDDLSLAAVGQVIARTSLDEYIRQYESARLKKTP